MKILVLHGPNLNMLEFRDKKHYGNLSLLDIYQSLIDKYQDVNFTFYQSNHEGELIDLIHNSFDYDAILFNLGAYTHTSIALRDALELVNIIKVDVHLSKISEREDFRKINYMKDVSNASFEGMMLDSYFNAVDYILNHDKKI